MSVRTKEQPMFTRQDSWCFCRVLGTLHNSLSQNVRRSLLVVVALCYLVPGVPRAVLAGLALGYLIPGFVYYLGVSGRHQCDVCHAEKRVPAHARTTSVSPE
jgi:hypothetical protein